MGAFSFESLCSLSTTRALVALLDGYTKSTSGGYYAVSGQALEQANSHVHTAGPNGGWGETHRHPPLGALARYRRYGRMFVSSRATKGTE